MKLMNTVATRFRGFYPVVVDVETAGFNATTDALLEITAVTLTVNGNQQWCIDGVFAKHIHPFEGANMDRASLEFTGIDPYHPFRKQIAVTEKEALHDIFCPIRKKIKEHGCKRAVLVGHNASFDLGFLNASVKRVGIKRNPFHPFSTFDTAALCGLAYGQTVLSRAVKVAGFEWDEKEAHSARYDAEKTALIFCDIVNKWNQFSGFVNPEAMDRCGHDHSEQAVE